MDGVCQCGEWSSPLKTLEYFFCCTFISRIATTRSSKRPLAILRTPSPFVFSLTELKLNFRYLKVGIGFPQNTTSFYPRAPLTARVDASDLLQAKLP